MPHPTLAPQPPAKPRLAAIVHVDLSLLRALLQLPADAQIAQVWLDHSAPDTVKLQLFGAGWPVAHGCVIPTAPSGLVEMIRHGRTKLNRVTVDWQLPSHPGPITTLRNRTAQRGKGAP